MRKQGHISASIEAVVAFHDVDAAQVVWHGHYLIASAESNERVARAKTVQVAVETSSGVLQFATPKMLLERVENVLQPASEARHR